MTGTCYYWTVDFGYDDICGHQFCLRTQSPFFYSLTPSLCQPGSWQQTDRTLKGLLEGRLVKRFYRVMNRDKGLLEDGDAAWGWQQWEAMTPHSLQGEGRE